MLVQRIKDSPDNVYFNTSFTHKSFDGSNNSRAYYVANKTTPIVDKAEDYYMSIVQFSIPLDQVPILICPVLTTNGNSNTTPLVIGIRDFSANVYYAQNLIWTPELTNEPVVVQTGGANQIITPYYYMYSYETLINMFNSALQLAFTAYDTANPGNPHTGLPCPFFVYDANSQLISLVAHQSWITHNPLTQSIYINNEGYTFLDSLPSIIYPNSVNSAIEDNVLTVYFNGINGFPSSSYPTTPTYVRMLQDYSTLFLWASVRKIVITSGSLPINFEQTPIFNNENPDQFNSLPIIADFVPNVGQTAGESRQIAYYVSQFYRLIDLTGGTPLNKIQFEIFWADKQNNLYQLEISNYQEATLKVVFVHKSLYLGKK